VAPSGSPIEVFCLSNADIKAKGGNADRTFFS
jgi:hypothetical protein